MSGVEHFDPQMFSEYLTAEGDGPINELARLHLPLLLVPLAQVPGNNKRLPMFFLHKLLLNRIYSPILPPLKNQERKDGRLTGTNSYRGLFPWSKDTCAVEE